MEIDDNVLEAIQQRLRVTLRVTGPVARDLGPKVESAIENFHVQWEASPPVVETGAMMPPPRTSVAIVSPNVIVNLTEISDGDATAARLFEALTRRLPNTASVSLLSVPSKAFDRRSISLLHLRSSVVGTPFGYSWSISSEVANRIDDAVERWLGKADFQAELWMDPLEGGRVPLAKSNLREALASQRAKRDPAKFVALGHDEMRAAAVSYVSAHVSFGSGVPSEMGDEFDWSRHLQLLEVEARSLADITCSAFVAFCDVIGKVGGTAFRTRNLREVVGRKTLMPWQQRHLEQQNLLVDAQGVFYLSASPVDLPAGYEVEPFAGSLFRVRLPDFQRWLVQLPDASMLDATRTELADTLMRSPSS